MSFNFVTVLRSGGVYSPEWVARLNRQAREHLKPDRIVCLTDTPPVTFRIPGLDSPAVKEWLGKVAALAAAEVIYEGVEYLPLMHNWPGWFSKLEIFRPGLFTAPCLYVDLDSLILRPIPGLEAKITAAKGLMMLDDFFAPSRPASGVMAWTPNEQTERIYHEFVQRTRIAPGWQNGDGAIIGQYPHGRLQKVFPGAFGSYKKDKLNDGPRNFAVVCQHGKPKFNDLHPSNWMYKEWIKCT